MYLEKFGVDGAVDAEYWAHNNPATIASKAPGTLRRLAIYIEAGREDGLELHRGTELLHRILWDNGVKHEYRHILGANHVGNSLDERFDYAIAFIGRQWNPPPEDEVVTEFRNRIAPQRPKHGPSGQRSNGLERRLMRDTWVAYEHRSSPALLNGIGIPSTSAPVHRSVGATPPRTKGTKPCWIRDGRPQGSPLHGLVAEPFGGVGATLVVAHAGFPWPRSGRYGTPQWRPYGSPTRSARLSSV